MFQLSTRQRAVVDTLNANQPCSLKTIMQRTDQVDSRTEAQNIVAVLVAHKIAMKQPNGYYKLEKDWKSNLGATPPPKPKPINSAPPVKEVFKPRITGGQIVSSIKSAPIEAIERLEIQLKGRSIQNLETKLQTLDRLAQILDPSIGEVLNANKTDIQEASCA